MLQLAERHLGYIFIGNGIDDLTTTVWIRRGAGTCGHSSREQRTVTVKLLLMMMMMMPCGCGWNKGMNFTRNITRLYDGHYYQDHHRHYHMCNAGGSNCSALVTFYMTGQLPPTVGM